MDLFEIADSLRVLGVGAVNTALGITSPVSASSLGIKLTPTARVNVSVTFGSLDAHKRIAGGLVFYEVIYRVLISIRLNANSTTAATVAETDIIKCFQQFMTDVYADPSLAGLVEDMDVKNAGTNDPEYRSIASQEYREIPIDVYVTVHGPFNS